MPELNFERASYVIHYNPETGEFTWNVTERGHIRKGRKAGCRRHDGYWLVRIDHKLYLGHRIAWLLMTGDWPTHEVDHIDGNPANNKWDNLRELTHSQNITNQSAHKDGKLKEKGISLNKNGRYYVLIKGHSLGGYPTLDEAKVVRDEAAKRILGELYRS